MDKITLYCYGGKLQEMPYSVHRFWTIDETKAFLSILTIEKSESEFLQKIGRGLNQLHKTFWKLVEFTV